VQYGDDAGEMPGADLAPIPPFLLNMIRGIDAASQAPHRNPMRFGPLQNKDFFSADKDQYLVAGLQAQRFTSLTRDHDLIFCRKSCFCHRFTF
jgi:hypothetical protein